MENHYHEPVGRFSRRAFLKSGAVALLASGMGSLPTFIARAAASGKFQPPYSKNKILVCIFQRGAMDGLMAVTPFTDKWLRQARPNLFIDAAIKEGNLRLADLDGRFGLHPSMNALLPLFGEKRLAIVHGVGSPHNSRSHFDAQDYMESGTPFSKTTESGWLNRVAGLTEKEKSAFKSVSLTSSLPRSFYGPEPALAISNLEEFALQVTDNPVASQVTAQSFEELYDQASGNLLNQTGKESFEALKMLKKAKVQDYQPANGAIYPQSPLGNALKQIAMLVKMDLGLELAFTDCGGWDTHVNQGTSAGIFARNAADLANSIHAFYTDLGKYQDDVTLLTMTEFGRTVKQNGTGGTDHGRASCMFVLGNDVNGGMVYGSVPELAPENLEDHRDLPVTTDFRKVFSEVAGRHLRIENTSGIFPGFSSVPLGIIKKG
jgi:uncharacterized protein (DUF1501 family)